MSDIQTMLRDAGFLVRDSGKRETYDSGMVRDTTEGKVDYTLPLDGPMFDRWAAHLTKASSDPMHNGPNGKYPARNWMQANSEVEWRRFKASAMRHIRAWLRGDRDEDHAAAAIFNINGAEYVLGRLTQPNEEKLNELHA